MPLFTGFMYACVGSYLCRAWRLFDFEFSHHPRRRGLTALSVAIYVNFFATITSSICAGAVCRPAAVRAPGLFQGLAHHRSMPLLLGLVLVSLFIWFSENIGTFTRTWLYPSQLQGWSMVSFAKLGSWFLLLIISYTLVSLVNAPRERRREEHMARGLAVPRARTGASPSAAS